MWKAISVCFPTSKQVLCCRHIRENVGNYLANKVGVRERDHGRILNLLFGESGVAKADDTLSLDRQLASLQTEIDDLSPEAVTYINRVLPNIKDFVNKPHRELRNDTLWTNNGCESLNNILKVAINWRPQQMPELIRTLQAIVGKQFVDLKRSLCGQGNYVLYDAAKKLTIDHRGGLACRKRSTWLPSDVFCDLKCETLVKHSRLMQG